MKYSPKIRRELGICLKVPSKATPDRLDAIADAMIAANRVKGRPDVCLTDSQMRSRQSKEIPLGELAEFATATNDPDSWLRQLDLDQVNEARSSTMEPVMEITPKWRPMRRR